MNSSTGNRYICTAHCGTQQEYKNNTLFVTVVEFFTPPVRSFANIASLATSLFYLFLLLLFTAGYIESKKVWHFFDSSLSSVIEHLNLRKIQALKRADICNKQLQERGLNNAHRI